MAFAVERFAPESAVRQELDAPLDRKGTEPEAIERASERGPHRPSDPCRKRLLHSRCVHHRCKQTPGKARLLGRADDRIAIPRSARTGCVGSVHQCGGTRSLGRQGHGLVQAGQSRLHAVAACPHLARKPDGLANGKLRVTVRHREAVRPQVGHIGERIADDHARREPGRQPFELLGLLDDLAEGPGFRNQLVAAREHRNSHARRYGTGRSRKDRQEQLRGPRPGLSEVHMRVRVVGDDCIAALQHAIRQDCVEIQRYDDRNVVSENLAALAEQKALGVVFALGGHRAVQREVGPIHFVSVGQALQKLASDARKVGRSEQSPRRDCLGAVGWGQHTLVAGTEYLERAAHFFLRRGVVVQQFRAAPNHEICVAARSGSERRNLLLAFGDHQSRHESIMAEAAARALPWRDQPSGLRLRAGRRVAASGASRLMSVGPQFPPERSVRAHGSLPGLTAAEARRAPQMPGRIDGCDGRVAPASQRRVTGLK